jgi:hypothetical protein
MPLPEPNAVRAVSQVRRGTISQVFAGQFIVGSQPVPLGSQNFETFLPGGGACARVAGGYQITNALGQFRYNVWSLDPPFTSIFVSGVDLDRFYGFPALFGESETIQDWIAPVMLDGRFGPTSDPTSPQFGEPDSPSPSKRNRTNIYFD